MPSSTSDHATAGGTLFPRGVPPAVASLLLVLLAVNAPERIEDLARLMVGV